MRRSFPTFATLLIFALIAFGCDAPTSAVDDGETASVEGATTLQQGPTPNAGNNGRWTDQVTGGVRAKAGGTIFKLTVSARTDGNVTKGQVEYARRDLNFHGQVECFYTDQDGNVALGGPKKDQKGSLDGDWMYINIKENGQKVRVQGGDAGKQNCGESGNFPGKVISGFFNFH